MASSHRSRILACALALMLTACATTVQPIPKIAPPPPVAAPQANAREQVRVAVDLLNRGRPAEARVELQKVLTDYPRNRQALNLLDQIDKDPKVLLGEKAYAYKVKPGETLSILAGRFLGDPLMFYALARYNEISAPAAMEVGQVLLIPGVPVKAPPPAAVPPPRITPPAPAAAQQRDPARASQLRRAALDNLSNGAVDRAVPQLRQALALDPGNGLIQRDLDRATRIQASLRSRS